MRESGEGGGGEGGGVGGGMGIGAKVEELYVCPMSEMIPILYHGLYLWKYCMQHNHSKFYDI